MPLEGRAAPPPCRWCLLGDLCFLCGFWLVTRQSDTSYLRVRGVTKWATPACTIPRNKNCPCILICTLTYVRSPITSQHHAEPVFSETAYWKRISTNANRHRDSRDIQVSRCPPHHPMVYKKQAWMTWIISTQSWPWRTLTVSIDLSGSLYSEIKHLG